MGSEAKKYEGKLFKEKESTNKGQKKQDAWLQNVQRKIEDPSSAISPEVRSMLEKLLGFDNIPRKQKPFTNFVKNSLKIWDDKKIAEIWDVISIANSVPNASNSEAHNTQKDAEPPSEPPPPPLPSMSRKRKCCGWKQALDDELQSVGGKL